MSIVLNCILTGLIIITIIEGVLVIVSAIDLMSWMDAVIDALDALPSFPQINSDTISRQDTIEAMEGIDWYHIDKDGQLVHGVNSKEDEPLYKAEDVYKVLNDMPSAQPDLSEYSDKLWKRAYERGKTEAQAEIVLCKDCKQFRRWIDTDICFCDITEAEMSNNDFCSKAERRTDE